jgi:hypothetical protein
MIVLAKMSGRGYTHGALALLQQRRFYSVPETFLAPGRATLLTNAP